MSLYDEIQALPDAQALLEAGNFHDIATTVSAGRTKVVNREGGIGAIMTALGPVGGSALLDQLETLSASDASVKWGFYLIKAGTLDFGLDSTRAMIDALVADPAANAALKGIAEVPDPVGWEACRTAINEGA